MRVGRSLPPAVAPIGPRDFFSGICGMCSGGKALERFRSELKEYFGVKHCFLVSSGKAAYALILMALKEMFPNRDDVLIPAFTCYSVPSAVIRAGLTPRLTDLHADSLDFDFARLSEFLSEECYPSTLDTRVNGRATGLSDDGFSPNDDQKLATKRLLAITPTHLFGVPSDVLKLRRTVQDPDVAIIEDAAQAMGESWENKKLGTLGDVGFFSLGRGKAFSTVEGGVILTDRDDIAGLLARSVGSLPRYGLWRLMSLISRTVGLILFSHPRFFWIPRLMPFLMLGETIFEANFPILQMSTFQAGLSEKWRDRLEKMRDTRKRNVKRWVEILHEIGDQGSSCQHLQRFGLLRFPIRVRDGDRRRILLRESQNTGAGIMPGYPKSINQLSELGGMSCDDVLPNAESCAKELVTLPTHTYVTQEDEAVIRRLLSRALAVRESPFA